jgi:lysyl-tRNA synthetase class 2
VSESRPEWRPAASLETLRVRAELLASIRVFFAERGVLEVETPVLGSGTVTDRHLHSFSCRFSGPGAAEGRELFLQTSPEFAMKRLLAAGSGPIFEISRAFRDSEAGRRHNPEFTMLEWYRPGWDHLRLMDEIDELLAVVLGSGPGERLSYAAAFERYAGIDPHRATTSELAKRARELSEGAPPELGEDRTAWLELILSGTIEPKLGRNRPAYLYDFPAEQAALARVRPGDPPLAERFELYVGGVELANGYNELTDPVEQRRRFDADLRARSRSGLPEVPIDERLLGALEAGLPDCAGVALGVDRLIMLKSGVDDIREVMAFPIDRV